MMRIKRKQISKTNGSNKAVASINPDLRGPF